MLTHALKRPRNSVYSLVMFLPFVVAKTCFYCIVETSSKSGNLRGIPIKISVGLQRERTPNSNQVSAGSGSRERVEEAKRLCSRDGDGREAGEGPAS